MSLYRTKIKVNSGGYCLASKDKFLAERIYKLKIPWKFEDDWTKLADVCKMLLLIENIFKV